MSNKKLLRQQLAKIAPDPRSLRALEQSLETTEVVTPQVISELTIAAGNAESTAVQSLGQLTEFAQSLSIQVAIAESKAQTALSILKDIQQSTALFELAPPLVPPKRIRYGSFYDTTTQTAAAINTAYAITYNTSDLSHGVYLGSPSSRIYVDTNGVYDFQFSIQVDKTAGGTALFWIWARKNGTDVANSASQIRIQGNNAEIFTAANYFFDLKAGDYVEFVWATDDTSVELAAFAAAAPVPAIPSIIVTVSNNISP